MHEPVLAAVFDASDEGIVAFDRDGRCRFAGRRIGELFGLDQGTLVGRGEIEVMQLLAACCEEPETLLQLATSSSAPSTHAGEIEISRPGVRVVSWQSAPIVDASNVCGWLGIARDITRERSAERRAQQLQQRLELMTAVDGLTRLANRRRFVEELRREHARAARAWDSYAVLRIDVDALASINEELGRPRGDEVLEQVADRMRQGRREYDLLARYDSDEFIMLLPGGGIDAARVVAERMRDAVASAPLEIGVRRTVTVSIGAAVWRPPSIEASGDVVQRAGDALALSYRQGPGEITIDGER